MERVRKTMYSITIAMAIAIVITIGALDKTFAAPRWCLDGVSCTATNWEWGVFLIAECSSTNGSGLYFGCYCGISELAVPSEPCSVM